MNWLLVLSWWLALLGGLVPSAWFLARYWPAKWREAPAVIVRGLVGVAFLAYIRPVVSLALTGWVPHFRGGWFPTTWSYLVMVVADVILVRLLLLFLRYRRAYVHESGEIA